MILGRYSPRLFLMTTPCYDFNQLFTPPEDLSSQTSSSGSSIHASDLPIVREGGFLDPTGRTTRVFRHSDHKFEWTCEEFKNWCISQAEQWGYDVEYGGIGRATDPDPWGRDFSPSGEPLRATFTAIFRRRAHRHQPPATLVKNSVTGTSHQLILDIEHPAHSSSNKPLPLEDIRDAMQECFLDRREGNSIEVYDLWGDDTLAVACGGSLETLFASVDTLVCETNDWEWDSAGRSRWRRRIVWKGYTERQRELPEGTEMSPVEGENSQEEDYFFPEESSWNSQEGDDLSVWETGVAGSGTLDDHEASPSDGAWNRDVDGWGSPQGVQTELDDWGDWDEKQLGETKRDVSVW